jgi:hypothetical protein
MPAIQPRRGSSKLTLRGLVLLGLGCALTTLNQVEALHSQWAKFTLTNEIPED